MKYFNDLLSILNEMSPYLLLGFFISGLLHVYVPRSIYSRFFHRKGFRSVLGAAALGVPLPLCSCGVIPTSVSLKKEGASAGAVTSFLVATPQTGIDSILATYSLLGLPFAIIRPIAAFVVAIFCGTLVDLLGDGKGRKVDYTKMKFAPKDSGVQPCGCGCSHTINDNEKRGDFWDVLRYGYVDLMQDFGKWLVVGLLVAAAITAFVPDSFFTFFKDYYILNILLILLISAPMYICATGSIPIALSLMLKGVTPGTAFVLLMAGPATNFASLIILRREIGMRKTVIYLLSIIVGAIFCAVIIDYLLPHDWFSSLSPLSACGHDHVHDHHAHDQCHNHEYCSHGPNWWQTTISVIFIALFTNAFFQKWKNRQSSCK